MRQSFSMLQLLIYAIGSAVHFSAYAITTTATVPAGVRAVGFVHANTDTIDSNINARGNLEYLSRSVNRSLTLSDLAKSEPRLNKLKNVLNELSPDQWGDQLLLANLYADVSVQESRSIGGFFWGLTDRAMVGLIVPRISRQYRANFRAEVVNNAADIRKKIGNNTKLSDGLKELADYPFGTKLFEDRIFRDKGFQPLHDFDVTSLGDIESEMDYRYFESPRLDLLFQTTVRFPTASHQPDITNLMDREVGDGSVAFRLGSLHNLKLVPDVLFWQSAIFGTWHAPSHLTLAVARSPEEDLPDLNDPQQIEEVRRHLGSQVDLDTGLQLDLWKGLISFYGSYQYSAKASDLYQGSRNFDYARLMKDTDFIRHSYELAAQFSAVPLYKKKRIPIPGKIVFTWHEPLTGKNTIYSGYGRLDAILFF